MSVVLDTAVQPETTSAPVSLPVTLPSLEVVSSELSIAPSAPAVIVSAVSSKEKTKSSAKKIKVLKAKSTSLSGRKRLVRNAHDLVPPDSQLLKRPALKRLARRAGIKRLSGETYAAARQITSQFVKRVVNDALLMTKHAGRKTVTSQDVLFALKQLNHPVM